MANEIRMFFHCRTCLNQLPGGKSPRDWVRMEAGWTPKGIQIWCVRCDQNIIHLDFMGQKVDVC
jgi:hypothetical protein